MAGRRRVEVTFGVYKRLRVSGPRTRNADCCCGEVVMVDDCTELRTYMNDNWTAGANYSNGDWSIAFPTFSPNTGPPDPNCEDWPASALTNISSRDTFPATQEWRWNRNVSIVDLDNCGDGDPWTLQTSLHCPTESSTVEYNVRVFQPPNPVITWAITFTFPFNILDIFSGPLILALDGTTGTPCCLPDDDITATFIPD